MIRHEWARIELDGRPLWVSLDAYMVDGVRRRFSHKEAVKMAYGLGGRLPTPRELDARWNAAGLHNLPHPGNPVSRTDREHSSAVDRDLAEYEARYGEPYRWIVGNVGKHWCLYKREDKRITPFVQMKRGRCPEYGWHADIHTKRLMPAPVHPAEALSDAWVIQRPWDSSHGETYSDYAMTGVFARDTQPDRWWEIAPNGYPRVVNALTVAAAEPEPDPEPLSARIAAWMLSHEGHAESPPGSNTSPLIDKWAEYCTRAINGVEQPIGKSLWTAFTGSDWCAVTYSAAVSETRGELWPAFTGRVSVSELMADAKKRGDFVPLDDVIKGKAEPEPGWAVLWPRFDPGTTRITWRGHVDTWLGWGSRAEKTADVIGGNVGNKVTRRVVPLVNGALSAHGFIRVPDDANTTTTETEPLRNDAVSLTKRQAKGVDVSHHQAPRSIDWPRLSADFGFAIIRAAYGLSPDRYFVEHVRQARAHGMRVGAYTYVRADADGGRATRDPGAADGGCTLRAGRHRSRARPRGQRSQRRRASR